MSTLDELAGIPQRAAIIRIVVRQTFDKGEPLTLANVGLAIAAATNPTFGELGEDELAAAVAELEQPAAEPESEAAPVESLPTMTADELNAATRQVENDLVVARRLVLGRQQEQRQARNAFTNACNAFERGGKPITREQLQRETIAANQAYKQGIKDGTIEPPRLPGRATGSYFDRMSGHDGGPGAPDRFVRKSHNAGEPFRGGKRFARGDVFDRTTNSIRPKLPNEL